MAYIDNYPNAWKDGYSSADDPDLGRGYISEAERWRLAEERRRNEEYNKARKEEEQRRRDRIAAEISQREFEERKEEEARENGLNRYKAERIIVNQEYYKYYNKSFLGRAVACLRGRSFEQMKARIEQHAKQVVARMTDDEVENFVNENYGKNYGKRGR